MPEALKPCPFCGGEADVREYRWEAQWVQCERCHSRTDRYGPTQAARESAITAWNTRPTDPEIARLQDLVAKFQRGGVSTMFAEGNVDG